MLKIYVTKSCSLVRPLLLVMESLGIAYVLRDIDADADAGQFLLNKTGDLVVPTLELDNGDFISRPSIEKLRELFAPEEAREAVYKAEQEQLLAQNIHRLKGIAAWGRYLNLVIIGCALFWIGGKNPLGIDPAKSIWWLIGVSLLLLVISLAGKISFLKSTLGKPGIKKVLLYGLFFVMTYLMGLSFISSQVLAKQNNPVPILRWLVTLGAGILGVSVTLQMLKHLWGKHTSVLQRVQKVLGILSLLGFAGMLFFTWKMKVSPPPAIMWFMLGVLLVTLLVNIVFAVARMRSMSAIEKAGPVLYPAFAMLSLLAALIIST